MRNRYLERMDSIVKIKIVGSNIHNYLKRVMKNKIQYIEVIPISYREINLVLKYSEYQKLLNFKSIYEITILQYMGKLKWYNLLKKNTILLLAMIIGFFGIVFLSRLIFSIEVIHQDREIRDLLIGELKKYDISRYSLKKGYEELEKIEDKILEENKDSLEWVEIINYGTKYIVRVEDRKLNGKDKIYQYRSIVSKKSAVLVEVDAISGEKVKNINDYVKKGDTVISGYITLPNNTKIATMADGTICGEVWYRVNVDYPIVYQETNLTGKSKDVYVLNFLDHKISLFNFSNYHSFKSKNKVLIESNLLGIQLVREKQYEVIIKDEVYTEDIARNKAIDYISEKMINGNEDIKKIKDIKILSTDSDEDSIRFELFISTIEDIGEVIPIDDVNLNTE